MQLISLDKLEELVNAVDTVESASTQFKFDDVVAQLRSSLKKTNITKAYNALKKTYLKQHCPPIKYIAEGSSRAAYACNGGKCLKNAMTNAGIAQNKQEFKNMSDPKWICFTQIYDADKNSFSAILTECCAKMKDADFKKAFGDVGITYVDELMNVFRVCIEKFNCNVTKTLAYCKAKLEDAYDEDDDDDIKEFETSYGFWSNVKASKQPQYEVLRNLVDFYKAYGKNSLEIMDLYQTPNCGFAIRNKKIVPVILDAGFSTAVKKQYY